YGRANPNERVLVSDGEQVLVDAAAGGDEPVELALKLAGKAVVVADADRISAAKWALEKFGVTVFVLDDGFQHRPAKRDLDIVCIDATDPFGGNEVLPAGRLREPLENLRRANAIVITRADLSDNIEDLRSEISNLNPSAAVFLAENLLTRVTLLEEFHAKTRSAQSRKVEEALNFNRGTSSLAFCALGNPSNFFSLLDSGGFEVWQTKAFSDHHSYSQKDILELERISRDVCVEQFLTTEKDAVKLNDLRFEIPCYVVEIKTAVSDADQFRTLITAS
ncbi:MAG: tetraacyldisaccharide 4'-kinase, partial [Pyrinomonadaceae bacterium]